MYILALLIIAFILYQFVVNQRKGLVPYRPNIEPKKDNYISDGPTLYKLKGIKRFDLRGIQYRSLLPIDEGQFVGIAKCDYNSHDQYAVAIFNERNVHIGFVPKGNKRLHDSLSQWHGGNLFVWGGIEQDSYDKKWRGEVYIPIGLSSDQIEKLEEIFSLLRNRDNILNKDSISSEEYFTILDFQQGIINNVSHLKDSTGIHYKLPELDALEVIKYKMTEMGMKAKDLEPIIGSKGHVSAILSGKREITLKMAQKLKNYFRIPAEVFLHGA